MKRLILMILSVMAFAGIAVSQDIYTSGYYYNSGGTDNAAVYKNGMMLYSTGDDATLQHESVDVIFLNDDVYWVDNIYDMSFDPAHANVFKNGDCWLNTAGSQSNICSLFTDGTDVYAAGTVVTGGVLTPVVWKNDEPTPFVVFNGGYEGSINDAVISNGVIYACGVKDEGNGLEGVVWLYGSDGSDEIDYGYVTPKALAVYNNSVYIVSSDAKVYDYYSELYTLTSNGGVYAICVDAGDVYVLGYEYVAADDSYPSRVWKNGSVLYEGPVAYEFGLEANSYGVFYLMYDMEGKRIWKDGAPYYAFGADEYMYGMFIDPQCQINDYRTLPYLEDFENGMTDWTCWAQWDGDNQNDGYASYWQRRGEASDVPPASGQYCAYHRYNGAYDQNGILATPLISIPESGDVTMTFKTYEEWPGDYYYEGVWVVEGGHKVLGEEVWTQTEPSAEWKTVTIDLSAYHGKNIAIDFRYLGINAHSWYIDDVEITSDYQPCPPIAAPYIERFDTGLGECMYVIEADHDGSCWEWELACQAAVHPNSPGSNQGGVLLTPTVMLSASKAYQLNFDFRASIPTKGESWKPVEFSVWMGVDSNGLGDLEDFNEIWRRVPVASTNEFETVTIDLTPCSGHSVQFGFVYEGNGEYGWLVDNIAVVESTGVDENGPSTGSETLVIYPNPASDRIRIEGLEAGSEVQLFNALGELVKTAKVDADSEIGIAELAPGLYLVRCGNKSLRFVKE